MSEQRSRVFDELQALRQQAITKSRRSTLKDQGCKFSTTIFLDYIID